MRINFHFAQFKPCSKIKKLALVILLATSAAQPMQSQAQSAAPAPARIQPPDILSETGPSVVTEQPEQQTEEAPPPTSVATPVPAPTVEEAPLETDLEPVPIIKKNKQRIDRSARPESRFIEHPNAKKGLIKIDKNKVYHYKVPESEQTKAGNFKIAFYEPSNLENPDDPSRANYDSIYDGSASPLLLYEHEWQIGRKFGKFGLTAGGGFFFAKGNGQFADPNNPDRAREEFMLFVFPIHVGAVYRLQYYDTQRFAPYVGGGVGGMAFAERRDDDLNPSLGAALGFSPNAVGYAGVAFQMGSGARSFLDLDREYGINKFWLTAEYRTYIHIGGDYDFGSDAINGGFTAEF